MPEQSTTPDLEGLTRRFVDASNRGDLEALMGFFAPDPLWEALVAGDKSYLDLDEARAAAERLAQERA